MYVFVCNQWTTIPSLNNHTPHPAELTCFQCIVKQCYHATTCSDLRSLKVDSYVTAAKDQINRAVYIFKAVDPPFV